MGMSSSARAGSYTDPSHPPVYSSGSAYSFDYAGGGSVSYGGIAGTTAAAPYSVTTNVPITATYTWTPDPKLASDPPPASIIVAEDSLVGYYCPGGSGRLDTGLSASTMTTGGGTVTSDQVVTGGNLILDGLGGAVYGQIQQTRYRIVTHPGTTLTFHCAPLANASLQSYYGQYSIIVRYYVTLRLPVTVQAHTTFDTAGWDPTQPRFLPGRTAR